MESWGCQVRTAEDGRQAMQVAQSWVRPPDIVISDLKLGDGRSGLDVLNALARHYGSASHPPFARLLITGETKSDRLREISAAKIPVLYKPVSPNQLREAIVPTLALKVAASSDERTSELQSLMRISFAVFCFNIKTTTKTQNSIITPHHNS